MGLEELQVGIFRHGQAYYKQIEATIENANDLTPAGIDEVRVSAKEFSRVLFPHRKVVVYSSPTGRTLHSTKVLAETLDEQGISDISIIPYPELIEVKGFDWRLYKPLVDGGQVSLNGNTFYVDAIKTNPEGLSHQVYFIKDMCHHVAQSLRGELPDDYLDAISAFERYRLVTGRMANFLRRMMDSECDGDIIAVTHEGLVHKILGLFSGGRVYSLKPGDYIHLEKMDSGLYVKKAGSLTEGNGQINLLEELTK